MNERQNRIRRRWNLLPFDWTFSIVFDAVNIHNDDSFFVDMTKRIPSKILSFSIHSTSSKAARSPLDPDKLNYFILSAMRRSTKKILFFSFCRFSLIRFVSLTKWLWHWKSKIKPKRTKRKLFFVWFSIHQISFLSRFHVDRPVVSIPSVSQVQWNICRSNPVGSASWMLMH